MIKIGAGRATNAVLYAERGAKTTVLDVSSLALDQARELFGAHGLEPETVEADIFDLPEELLGSFDVAMSFGLCEHFLGERRARSIAVHLELVRPGGLALVSVPNRWSPIYRAWMAVEKRRGTWRLGTEEPFTVVELRRLAEQAGGEPLEPVHGSLVASVVGPGTQWRARQARTDGIASAEPAHPGRRPARLRAAAAGASSQLDPLTGARRASRRSTRRRASSPSSAGVRGSRPKSLEHRAIGVLHVAGDVDVRSSSPRRTEIRRRPVPCATASDPTITHCLR